MAATGYEMENGTVVFKLSVCGNVAVGKTSILKRIVDPPLPSATAAENEMSSPRPSPTIVMDFDMAHRIVLADGTVAMPRDYPTRGSEPAGSTRVVLQIWDTAGCDRWRDAQKTAYRNCHVLLAVFDLTRRDTFEDITNWLCFALNVSSAFDPYVILIGNKLDLTDRKREVTTDDVQLLCLEHNYCYMETSAKDATGIEELGATIFLELVSNLRAERRRSGSDTNLSSRIMPRSAVVLAIDPLELDTSLDDKLRVVDSRGTRIHRSSKASASLWAWCSLI